MSWTELESYLKFTDTSYTSMQNRLKAMEHLMKDTQLTISLEEKLLMATEGYSSSSFGKRSVLLPSSTLSFSFGRITSSTGNRTYTQVYYKGTSFCSICGDGGDRNQYVYSKHN